MKITGIILLIFAFLNFCVALSASASGASEAAGQKISAAFLLGVIGCVLFYFGRQKEINKKKEELEREQKLEQEKLENKRLEEQRQREEQKKREEARMLKEKELKAKEFEENSKRFQILDFYLDCSYCNKQENELKKCALALPIKKINIDDDDEMAEKYNVRQLPKLILTDYNGKEIKRWLGVTTSSEINSYLYANGYAIKPVEQECISDDEEDYPKPLSMTLTKSELAILQSPDYMDKVISIGADGGTKEQTMVKFEVLLGKREKTEAMLEVEKVIRNYFRTAYSEACKDIDLTSDNKILRKLSATTKIMEVYNLINGDDGEVSESKAKMINIANEFGVSFHIIGDEEHKRALSIYRDGLTL